MENFRRLLQFFLQFFGKFLQFFWNFLRFFWKIFPKIFAIFFDFCDFPTVFPENFSENFSENSRLQSVTVQPGSRHYCKFTSKFTSRITPKFTPILIKILQSTNLRQPLLQVLTGFHNPLSIFPTLCPLPKPFPLFVLLSLRRRIFSTIAPPCQRHQRPSLPLRRRRYVGNTRDYK